MYCYGSSFHASRLRLVIATPSSMMQQTRSIVASQAATVTRPIAVTGTTILPSPNEKVNRQSSAKQQNLQPVILKPEKKKCPILFRTLWNPIFHSLP